jgi:oxygen-independent coproporphyrinogen-3 oxidase
MVPACPGLYLHVPFCLSKCAYCTFYSVTDLSLIPLWLKALPRELALYRERFPLFDSLYLGGGTPSLLTAPQLETLFAALRPQLSFTAAAEITLEANPDDITPEKLRLWRDLGVNRLSLGVQSLSDPELALLGRRHRARQALWALDASRAAGFNHLNVDLMFGLPGHSPRTWLATLEKILAWRPEHLSCYELTWEEGARLTRLRTAGRLQPPSETRQRSLFLLTAGFLAKAGYSHYEVSNFARRPAHRCLHNLKYWRRQPYLGLGPAAHSFFQGRRWWNHPSLADYCRLLAQGAAPLAGGEELTPPQVLMEQLYLGFRTQEGVPLPLLRRLPQGRATLSRLVDQRLLKLTARRAVPTRQGYLLADGLPLLFLQDYC